MSIAVQLSTTVIGLSGVSLRSLEIGRGIRKRWPNATADQATIITGRLLAIRRPRTF